MHEVLNNKRMWELKKIKKYYYNFVSDRKKNVIYLGLIYTSKSS